MVCMNRVFISFIVRFHRSWDICQLYLFLCVIQSNLLDHRALACDSVVTVEVACDSLVTVKVACDSLMTVGVY